MDRHDRTILICEEHSALRNDLEKAITSLGYSVRSVPDRDQVLPFLQNSEVEISALFLDAAMPNQTGLDLLRGIRATDSKLPVILVVGLCSVRDVVAALRSGATDVLGKPIIQEELDGVLAGALETSGVAYKSLVVHSKLPNGGVPRTFRSANPVVQDIESRAGQIGWSGAPVLIQGETGSGKEVLARKLHAQSTRANRPFLKLNCAALPSELVESELFGYERGAFTGAFERKAGIFELADGGTILLDEIGDMDIRLQAKLLQVLQDQEFRRIGGKENVKVNVRIMAATHRDLERAVHDRSFREDLYYRLNVIVLQVPPLRERIEDIVSLADFLIRKHADQSGPMPAISADLRHAMMVYNWPGNVRELENYMRKLVIFRDPDALARDLHARMNRKPPTSIRPLDVQVTDSDRRADLTVLEQVTKVNRQAEADVILAALASTRWNRKHAAAVLKMDYKSLLYKMKKLGIDDRAASTHERSRPPLQRTASGD
jgi:two-component system response regulator AtoC